MNNKNNSSSQNNSSPFPKLKPKGSIILHQTSKNKESNEKSNNNEINKSNENTENTNFLSKLKLFDPNPKTNRNSNSIKHSKTFIPNDMIFEENEKNEKKEKTNEIKTNNEKNKMTKTQTIKEDNMNKKDEPQKDIAETLRISAKLHFNKAKKMFTSFSGYLKDNYLSKINLNLNFNLIKKDDKTFNFTKPPNFEEIENHWNYDKLLLDNNILDFTSKFKKIIYF